MAHNTKLKAGKAIGAFDDFVDTFNFLVDFCNNLKGEGEIVGGEDDETRLRVDRTSYDHPVIRGSGSGSGVYIDTGGGGGGGSSASGSFRLISEMVWDSTTHSIKAKYSTVTYNKGRLSSMTLPADTWETVVTADPLYTS